MEHLINEINQNTKKALDKIDEQSKKITELTVKVDLYRETQNEHSQKIDWTEKMATEALTKANDAHKRLEARDGEIIWMKRTLIAGFISFIFALCVLLVEKFL